MYKAQLEKELEGHALPLLGVLPFNPLISSVRLDEIQAALNVDMISGRKHHADLTVNQVRSLESSVSAKHPVYACIMDMYALLRAAYTVGQRQAWWTKQETAVAAGVCGHSRLGKHTGKAFRPGQHKTPGVLITPSCGFRCLRRLARQKDDSSQIKLCSSFVGVVMFDAAVASWKGC